MNLIVINDISNLAQLMTEISNKTNIVGLDIETSSLDTITNKIYLVQLSINDTIYVINCLKFTNLEYIVGILTPHLIVGHNIKFDIKTLYNKTGILLENVYDTMLGEVLLTQGLGEKYVSLETLVEKYTGVVLDKSVRESFYSNGDISEITQEQLIYSALDVKYLAGIREAQLEKLESSGQSRVVDLEMKLLPVVSKMECNGVLLDVDQWKNLMEISKQRAEEISTEIKRIVVEERIDYTKFPNLLAVCEALKIPVTTKRDTEALASIKEYSFAKDYLKKAINIGSPKQMLAILNMLGVKIDSTGEKVLKESHSEDPVIKLLLEHRESAKRGNSFGESFLEKIHPVTGKIHAEAHQLGTDSGRFSYSNPNMQQYPNVPEYRRCSIAEEGWLFITTDYSQQELRLAGAITGEPKFIEAFKTDIDLHTLTASILFNVPIDSVIKSQRQIAKGFNFAILYGSSARGLAYNFNMELAEADRLLERFKNGYSTLYAFKDALEEAIVKRKYSSTLLGRKRYFSDKTLFRDFREHNSYIASIKKQGFNHIIQGTGADITKIALCKIHYENPFSSSLKIIKTIHDEIVVSCKREIAEEAQNFVVDCMLRAEQPFLGEIPAEVDTDILPYWGKTENKKKCKL